MAMGSIDWKGFSAAVPRLTLSGRRSPVPKWRGSMKPRVVWEGHPRPMVTLSHCHLHRKAWAFTLVSLSSKSQKVMLRFSQNLT